MDSVSQISGKIIYELAEAGLTQRQIAARYEVSQASVSRYMRQYRAAMRREGRCPCCGRKLPKETK